MRTNASFILMLFMFATLSSSCIHYYYAPSSNNVPLFKEKNEVRIQAQYSTVGISSDYSEAIAGFEIQSGYAVGNHAAVQLNFLHAGGAEQDYGSGSGNYIEAAGGYFKPLHNKNWVFETYAGLGTGSVKSIYYRSNESAKTSITKFFAQPSFGYSRSHFDIAFSSKFSLVNFGVRSSTISKDNNPTDYDYLESFKNGKSYFWWEPGLTIRGGFKQIKAFIQYTFTIQSNETLPFCNENFSIGVIVPFKIKSN
jgi:hypothetical protein